jgi:hypothetical protein
MPLELELPQLFAAVVIGDREALAAIDRQRAAEQAARDAEIARIRALRDFWAAVVASHPDAPRQ